MKKDVDIFLLSALKINRPFPPYRSLVFIKWVIRYQDRTAQPTFDLLVGSPPRPQSVADNSLIAKHLRFNQRAVVIAPLWFPACAPLVADCPQNFIASLRGALQVSCC